MRNAHHASSTTSYSSYDQRTAYEKRKQRRSNWEAIVSDLAVQLLLYEALGDPIGPSAGPAGHVTISNIQIFQLTSAYRHHQAAAMIDVPDEPCFRTVHSRGGAFPATSVRPAGCHDDAAWSHGADSAQSDERPLDRSAKALCGTAMQGQSHAVRVCESAFAVPSSEP